MSEFRFKLVREVVRTETLDVTVAAKNAKDAEAALLSFGEGESPQWPSIQRYNIVDIEPTEFSVVEYESHV